jgi:hypothetical protein
LALHRPVSSSEPDPIIGQLAQVTDGEKEMVEGFSVELGAGRQWVQVDLGRPALIYAIAIWHGDRANLFKDVVVQVSDDPTFHGLVRTVYNNDHDNSSGLGVGKDPQYIETQFGKLITTSVTGRYVRCWGNGTALSDLTQFAEVEVYGTTDELLADAVKKEPGSVVWPHM